MNIDSINNNDKADNSGAIQDSSSPDSANESNESLSRQRPAHKNSRRLARLPLNKEVKCMSFAKPDDNENVDCPEHSADLASRINTVSSPAASTPKSSKLHQQSKLSTLMSIKNALLEAQKYIRGGSLKDDEVVFSYLEKFTKDKLIKHE